MDQGDIIHFLREILPKAEIQARIEEWIITSVSVNILISGMTGTGKSTLVNGLIGEKVAQEGHTLNPTTCEVQLFQKKIGDVQVNIYDTPGLQDGTVNEAKYLNSIETRCKDAIDLFIYCISMSGDRFVPGGKDVTAMKKLTDVLGKDIWKNALFILTFANSFIAEAEDECDDDPEEVEKAFFDRKQEWIKEIYQALQEEVGIESEVATSVPVVPAGVAKMPKLTLRDDYWLSSLWFEALFATKMEAQPAMIKINAHRFESADEIDPDKFHKLLVYQPILFSSMGEKVGSELGVKNLGEVVGLSAGIGESVKMLFTQLGVRNGIFMLADVHVVIL